MPEKLWEVILGGNMYEGNSWRNSGNHSTGTEEEI